MAVFPLSVELVAIYGIGEKSAIFHVKVYPGDHPLTGSGIVFGESQWYGSNYSTPYPPYYTNQHPGPGLDLDYEIEIEDFDPNKTYYAVAFATENNADYGNGIYYSGERAFTTLPSETPEPAPVPGTGGAAPDPVAPKQVIQHRRIALKIEKLDSAENVIEQKTMKLDGGKVDVGNGGTRRKCSFDLTEALPSDWQANRWKLYYGYKGVEDMEIKYVPLGVFIPINPEETESQNDYITSFQGVDKTKLFSDFELDNPVTFTSGTLVRDIVKTVAGWFGETKLILAVGLGTLGADFTFEEGSTAEQLLNTLVSSFNAEWFYNPDGYLVARKRTDPETRPVRFAMDAAHDPLYISSTTSVDDDNYYNKCTVVGGKTDTPIYRATVSNADAIAAAGGRIVQRYFTYDAAVTQDQVTALATYYLSNGVLLPRQLKLDSLVIPDLEIGDIIEKAGRRYEVRGFDVPLGLASQGISAGEIIL